MLAPSCLGTSFLPTGWLSFAPEVWAAIIGGGALITTSIISWRASRATILANREAVVAGMREEWGEKFRNDVANLVSKSGSFAMKVHDKDIDIDFLDSLVTEIDRTQSLIMLRLNQDEKIEPHMELGQALVDLRDSMLDMLQQRNESGLESINSKPYFDSKNQVLLLTKQILKSNWEKVKHGN